MGELGVAGCPRCADESRLEGNEGTPGTGMYETGGLLGERSHRRESELADRRTFVLARVVSRLDLFLDVAASILDAAEDLDVFEVPLTDRRFGGSAGTGG
jgi:hypothetical protein